METTISKRLDRKARRYLAEKAALVDIRPTWARPSNSVPDNQILSIGTGSRCRASAGSLVNPTE
jgi:hypothetical protein